MTTPFDCALNGVLLSSLDERITVLDVQENAPKLRTTVLALHQEGADCIHQRRESITVQVHFAIHEEEPIRRQSVMRIIRTWAEKGGVFTTADRPGLQLTVICTSLPAITSEDWTEKCTLTFQTTRCPWWEDAEETAVSGSAVLTLATPGTADFAPVDALIINNSGETVTRLTIRAGSTQMVFEGIHFPAGRMFLLTQSDGPLTVEADGESVLSFRTADSDDMLLVPCGKSSTVYASASGPLQASFTVRGRYA